LLKEPPVAGVFGAVLVLFVVPAFVFGTHVVRGVEPSEFTPGAVLVVRTALGVCKIRLPGCITEWAVGVRPARRAGYS
jgi:hypothetical protein